LLPEGVYPPYAVAPSILKDISMTPNQPRLGFALLLMAVLALAITIPAIAQDGGRGGRGGGGERPRFEDMSEEDREAFREMIQQRMAERQAQMDEQRRETLGMSEEEYDLIQPMVAKIQQLTQERAMASRGGFGQGGRGGDAGGRGGRGGDAGGRGGPGGFGFGPEMSDEGTRLSEATTALREFIDDEDSSAKDINDSLSELRQAREAMDTAITEQREDLRALLTARQEAGMVLIGILD